MYSGLFESFKENKWIPTGIPTIVKLADKLSQDYLFEWNVVCKTKQESTIIKNVFSQFDFGNITINVIPYRNFIRIGRVNNFFNDLLTFRHIRKTSQTSQTIFYCDRSNIIIAALLKLFTKAAVVIRILGVYPDQKLLAMSFWAKILSPFLFFAYKIPYSFAIGTQDGSGIECYLDNLLNLKTKREILLNGVKKNKENIIKKPNNKITFLFVGKLIEEKGILELVDTVYELKKAQSDFVLNIVGKGHLEKQIRTILINKKMNDHIKLIGSVNQEEIHKYYAEADVYISLNKLGNLSNTVLEAMVMNKCIVMLGKDEKTYTDVYTEKMVPAKAVFRIDRNNIVEDLTEKLEMMVLDPDLVKTYSERMGEFADEFLWTWDERINHEINVLKQVSN